MSGQPYKYASDPVKFRAQYMESLKEQEEINDFNLQANKTYKATGQLPPASQMKDTRTTAEILADREKLKIGLIQDLKDLGSPQFIMALNQAIEKSPLNADGSLFTFYAQRAPELAIFLKKQYKYGIKGDQNDVSKFVSFIEDMYSKSKTMSGTVSNYFTKTGVSANIGVMKANDLNKIKEIYDLIKKQFALKAGTSTMLRHDPLMQIMDQIGYKLHILSKFLETEQDIELMRTFFLTQYGIAPTIQNYEHEDLLQRLSDDFIIAYKDYNDLLMKLPKYDVLNALMEQLERSLENKNDDLTRKILSNIDELIPLSEEVTNIMETLGKLYNDFQQFQVPLFTARQQYEGHKAQQRAAQEQARFNAPIEPLHPPVPANAKELSPSERAAVDELLIQIQQLQDEQMHAMDQDQHDKLQRMILSARDEVTRIRGYGLKKRRGRAKGSGVHKPYAEVVRSKADFQQGIQESPRFVKFGRYLVNQKMLGDGIFSIKSSGGYRVPDVPSTRLSKNLQGIITKMIKGGSLTYDELNTLSEPEKVFLHKVSKKSNIIDKFSIPTPSMEKKDKDIHDFEVMKGEILAGNDNKELIKKFKAHILRLSREEILPKKEVSEIMEILLELGH